MSGYGGGPPPGWHDPYGGGPYGQAPPGHGYGPPGVPTRSRSSGATVAALVCNIAGVLLCCGVLSIPGAVTAAIAMSRVDTDPESARTLTIWSWVLFGLSVVLGIAIFIIYIVAVVASEPNYDSSGGI